MAVEIVMAEGRFTLLPIAEEQEDGEPVVTGYYFRFSSGDITLVAPLPVHEARKLGQVLVDHAPDVDPVHIEVASPEVLRKLPQHPRQR